MQPGLRSLLGEILFIITSEGKLEEINVSTQVTKNFNTFSSAGSHLFFSFCPDGFTFLQLEALKLVADSNIYMSFSEKQHALFSGGGVGHSEIT